MKVTIGKEGCIVEKEPGDPRMGKESTFYYHLAKVLSERFDRHFIRKEMVKDGHWVDPHVFYATDTKKPYGYVYDHYYTLRNVAKDFDAGKPIDLSYELDREIYIDRQKNKSKGAAR